MSYCFVCSSYSLSFEELGSLLPQVVMQQKKSYQALPQMKIPDGTKKGDTVFLSITCAKYYLLIFRSTSKSRPNNIGGKMSVRTSVRPQSFFDLNEIWYIRRGR